MVGMFLEGEAKAEIMACHAVGVPAVFCCHSRSDSLIWLSETVAQFAITFSTTWRSGATSMSLFVL